MITFIILAGLAFLVLIAGFLEIPIPFVKTKADKENSIEPFHSNLTTKINSYEHGFDFKKQKNSRATLN
jgi:hypothetical protein